MHRIHRARRPVSCLLVCLLLVNLPLQAARAAMIGTEALLDGEPTAAQATATSAALRAQLRAQLLAGGVDPAYVDQRLATLTDSEVRTLAGRLGELPAAGSLPVAILFGFFVVWMFVDMFGWENMFPERGDSDKK